MGYTDAHDTSRQMSVGRWPSPQSMARKEKTTVVHWPRFLRGAFVAGVGGSLKEEAPLPHLGQYEQRPSLAIGPRTIPSNGFSLRSRERLVETEDVLPSRVLSGCS